MTQQAPDHLDRRYQRFYQLLCEFLPSERLITHPLLTYAYGTDASFYRLTPKSWCALKVNRKWSSYYNTHAVKGSQ